MTAAKSLPQPIEQEPAQVTAPPAEETAAERGYMQGKHSAYRQMLWLALHELNICKDPADDPLRELARVTGLLEDVRAALRRLCRDIGIKFDEELCLVDIIEKYIAPRTAPDEAANE